MDHKALPGCVGTSIVNGQDCDVVSPRQIKQNSVTRRNASAAATTKDTTVAEALGTAREEASNQSKPG
ncbi:hypothetical protein OPV22_013942 [Ensete ventricosum]|uniref:SMP domain-containing protein n=1 Tax=Ensete ventricosum TaxID=4639 RepID=A0AAV8R624_ENSVE|nr:hypothetical protein OPV22_013942 [Ensete ventricosum]